MENKKLAFGIDLGTTNSAISTVVRGVKPEIIDLKDGDILPSCVMWMGGDNFIVGKEAYRNYGASNVAKSFKRLMGSNETVTLEYNNEKRVFTPEELSSLVLKELAKRAEEAYGKVEDVVITVPAYFTDDQVAATRKAGEMAGFNVLSTFREPVASALVYISDYAENLESNSERLMVYDLGGGTFDVSIVDVQKTVDYSDMDAIYGLDPKPGEDSSGITLNVRGKYGDMHLGGDDIDNELAEIFKEKIDLLGYDSSKLDDYSKRRLQYLVEEVKKSKRIYKQTVGSGLKLTDGTELPDSDELCLTIYDVENATRKIFEKTVCSEAISIIEDATRGKLDGILLIGGSTKSQFIEKFLREKYPEVPINNSLNPDKAVCLGAGLQAHRLVNGGGNITLNDVLSLPIGILAEDRISKIIPKNEKVPVTKQKTFRTTEDDQEFINIDVYQGISIFPEDNHYIGTLTIDNIPKGKAGELPIYVKLAINVDGVLKCSVSIGDITRSAELSNINKGSIDTSKNTPKPGKKEERMLAAIKRQIAGNPKGLELLNQYEQGSIDIRTLYNEVNKLRKDIEIGGK